MRASALKSPNHHRKYNPLAALHPHQRTAQQNQTVESTWSQSLQALNKIISPQTAQKCRVYTEKNDPGFS
jgi:hypothetical protein